MQGKNLSIICNNVMSFFKKTITNLDATIKFAQRRSKLDSQLFAETLIVGCLSESTISLEGLCKLIKKRKVKISKQGLHKRFNARATILMQNLFQTSLQQFKTEKQNVVDLLKPFTSVSLLDSSGISLPENLKDIYKGFGGSASEAGLKLQIVFDYLYGQINQATITDGRKNDQSFDGHLSCIQKGSLHLQDLGYFKIQSFAAIQAKGAYFVSRYLNPTYLLNEGNEKVDLTNELRKAGSFLKKNVWLGQKEKIKVRLIAHRLSDEAAEMRIRKIKRSMQKKGKAPIKETLELTRWSIFITNVPETMLRDEQIYLVYTLRWQIELFFKLCKSEAGIDKISGKKSHRILCEFYAKLICIVKLLYICFPLKWRENQELSLRKVYKEFKLKALQFFYALKSPYRLKIFIKEFFMDAIDFSYKEHRKKGPLTYQVLMDCTGQRVLA